MKQYRIIALLLTLLLALAACGENSSASSSQNTVQEEVPSPVQVPFTLAVYADYSLNPTLAANRANLTLAPLLYEPLFAVDGHFQAQPVLCQSWTASEDCATASPSRTGPPSPPERRRRRWSWPAPLGGGTPSGWPMWP